MKEQHRPDGGVLIVEDDFTLRRLMAEVLLDAGYRVACAADGQEALRHLYRHRDVAPGIILLDVTMPNMNGVQFLVELQQRKELAQIPVVVVSGSRSSLKDMSAIGKVVGYLPKPTGATEMLQLVAEYCSSPD